MIFFMELTFNGYEIGFRFLLQPSCACFTVHSIPKLFLIATTTGWSAANGPFPLFAKGYGPRRSKSDMLARGGTKAAKAARLNFLRRELPRTILLQPERILV